MKHNKAIAWAATLILLLSIQTQAATITFEGHGNDGASMQFQEGFTFNFSWGPSEVGWGIFEDSFVGGGWPYTHNGTTRLFASGLMMTVEFFPTDGRLFSCSGFDAATAFPSQTSKIQWRHGSGQEAPLNPSFS